MQEQTQYPKHVDLSSCEKEPIHIIGTVQSHGVLIACDRNTGVITHISENSHELIGMSPDELLNNSLSKLLGTEITENIQKQVTGNDVPEVVETTLNNRSFILIPHFSESSLILDVEPAEEELKNFAFQKQLTNLLNTLSSSRDIQELCEDAAKITKSIFHYDRVMIYKFDEEWNGKVIAEEKNDDHTSWHGLTYPASDIPKQARELFYKNKVRIISNVNYSPVKIIPNISPANNQPLDLSNSKLRGISPIHIEYLQNMNVGASLTAALISNGKLWGLIACHHSEAKYVNYYQRQTCEFLIQILSNELSGRNSNNFLKNLEEKDVVKSKLISQVHYLKSIKKGLNSTEVKITDLVNSGGAAIVLDGKIKLIGETPKKSQVNRLIKEFLSKKEENLFVSKHLLELYPGAKKFTDAAAGILSVRIGQGNSNFLIWFRPEVIQHVNWGGDPKNKASYDEEKKRLTPRKSFGKWTEELKGVSEAWKDFEISSAKNLSESISYVILENQKKKIDKLNSEILAAHKELEVFSQGLSHDLKAPLRGVEGYALILKEDHFSNLPKEGRMAVDTILSSAEEMQQLIDSILSFATISNKNISKTVNSTDTIVRELLSNFNIQTNYPNTIVEVEEDLPKMIGDRRMLNQVWSNLIANALKYSERSKKPRIEIGYEFKDRKTIYFVKDNGIGFEPEYKEDIFELFTRRSGDNYQGTGIGLAIVKRIIAKHGGEIWAESEPESGSVFQFYI